MLDDYVKRSGLEKQEVMRIAMSGCSARSKAACRR
jgi:hypothetical protein